MRAMGEGMRQERRLDVVTVGRALVDLYGEQVGGRLEEMASFAKYVGGCPANIAVGCARLGLRAAIITRVGDEAMGRFVREQLAREGVDVRGVITDPERLTALVVLGIRDKQRFPLIFYRENCADAALCEEDIDPELIGAARAVVVTGTHFSKPHLAAASHKAMRLARAAGARVVMDVDYRPVLWGLTGHGGGEERYVASERVTAHLARYLPECDVIVGTEEEIRIAGGAEELREALVRLRRLAPGALIVVKRGPMGSLAFPGEIPEDLEQGVRGRRFRVEVYNVLGAGDAFMSGFLKGYLDGAPLAEALTYANACGAITVSRHGCAPAIPTWRELRHFLERGASSPALWRDAELERLHWSTTRDSVPESLLLFAADHRDRFQELAAAHGRSEEDIRRFKWLMLELVREVARSRLDVGILLDDRFGEEPLAQASGERFWLGRPIEAPGSLPLAFEGGRDPGVLLRSWPRRQCVKCLVRYHPEDPAALRAEQEERLLTLFEASRATGHELLLEVLPGERSTPQSAGLLAAILERFYDLGLYPDWWKLPDPGSVEGWRAVAAILKARDPDCRGVLLLGQDASLEDLACAFRRAVQVPVVRGFAIGRTIWRPAAEAWFAGRIGDAEAVAAMAAVYRRLIALWEEARASLEEREAGS